MRVLAFAVALALSTTALSTQAAFAQTVREAPEPVFASVEGSRWTGQFTFEGDAPVTWTAQFRAGGVMAYSYGGVTYENGRWLQNGGLVAFDLNDNFVVYVGAVSEDGDRIEGHMVNRRGQPGRFVFTRGR